MSLKISDIRSNAQLLGVNELNLYQEEVTAAYLTVFVSEWIKKTYVFIGKRKTSERYDLYLTLY